jgi:hypothetical protein
VSLTINASLMLDQYDIDSATIAVHENPTGRYATTRLGEPLASVSLFPRVGTDLAAVLRLLADRIDTAMAADESKAVS